MEIKKNTLGKALSIEIPLILIIITLVLRPIKPNLLINHFFSEDVINVIIAVILVQVFSNTIKFGNFDKKLQDSIRMLTKSKMMGMVLPSLMFGLLPMPAGALVSAPFVEKGASFLNLSKEKTFFVNYWFRHVWEYSWPLYAGVILGAGIMKISVGRFALIQSPLVLASFIIGLIPVILWTKDHPQKDHENFVPLKWETIIQVFLPAVLLFILTLILRVNVNIALLIVILLVYLTSKIRLINLLTSLRKSIFSFTTLLIITVLLLKSVIEKTNILSSFFNSHMIETGISTIIIGIIIAYISGFFTGITQASVGITFPIFLQSLNQNPYIAPLFYTAGFMGTMLSPFHLCYLTSKEYFNVSFKDTYKLILPFSLLMILFSLIYLLI